MKFAGICREDDSWKAAALPVPTEKVRLYVSIPLVNIYDALYRMGFKGDNTGFFYLSYAVYLCLSGPHPEQMLNEELYAMVGERYHARPKQVRRAVFRTIAGVWNTSPQQMRDLANLPLDRQPGGIEVTRILLCHILAKNNLNSILL